MGAGGDEAAPVSPGSRPRPSLSGEPEGRVEDRLAGVAGVSAPAFVERTKTITRQSTTGSVAGVSAPAFVERGIGSEVYASVCAVSPGSRPRPSLSGHGGQPVSHEGTGVAGVSAPAFVER